MTQSVGGTAPYHLPVRRLFWLPLSATSLLVLALLAGLVVISWRGLERIRPVQAHLLHVARIQDLGLGMEQTLLNGLRGARIAPADMERLRNKVQALATLQSNLHPDSKARLDQVAQQLQRSGSDPIEILFETLAQLRSVLDGEREQHAMLLSGVAADTEIELHLAAILLVVLPLAGGALLFLLRVRIKHPLDDLGDLLGRLAARDYRPVDELAVEDAAGLVQPVFHSYNALVLRLQALEEEHRAREHTLEHEVRQATEALLAQSRELARAERLAAVGAVSAGLAHELRNPLAGIQMACTKLHRQLGQSDQAARVGAVIAELKRLNNLLTEQVEAARHEPEVSAQVKLSALVGDLLALVRYQSPPETRLVADIPQEMACVVPPAGLRQALLNLLLNAIQAQEAGGRVTVTARHSEGQLVLRVDDEGPGFPDEMLRAGVRPFATGRVGGSGLGLAMVRRFTRDHGGELELSNREPRGARVTIHLPCSAVGDEEVVQHA